MSLSAGYVEGQPVTLLRDSGCRNIVVRKSLIKDEHFTGKHETRVLTDSRGMHPASVTCLKYYRYGLKRYPINQSTFASGEYEVWCIGNFVFDLIIGEVENARKPHDPDPYWKPQAVSTVETRQQERNKQKHTLLLQWTLLSIKNASMQQKVEYHEVVRLSG